MTNYILKYKGDKQPDIQKMTAVFSVRHVHIVDDSLLPGTVLIQMKETELAKLQDDLEGDWNIYPERTYEVPDPHQKIKKAIRKP
jgi:hypothetical protein